MASTGREGVDSDVLRMPNALPGGQFFPSVTISGNATVQLGDQYNDRSYAQSHPSRSEKIQSRAQFTSLIQIMKFLNFATFLVNRNIQVQSAESYTGLSRDAIGRLLEYLQHAHLLPLQSISRQAAKLSNAGNSTGQHFLQIAHASETLALDLVAALRTLPQSLEAGCAPFLSNILGKASTGIHLNAYECVQDVTAHVMASLLILQRNERAKPASKAFERLSSLGISIYNIVIQLDMDYAEPVTQLVETFWMQWDRSRKDSSAFEIEALENWLSTHTSISSLFRSRSDEILDTERTEACRNRILTSLHFSEMYHRYSNVKQAHTTTFEWLFDPQTYPNHMHVGSEMSSFARWLIADEKEDNGLFWVRGKPGSGKSTLMRTLTDDPRTKRLAQQWSGRTRVPNISTCFFWAAGTTLQKSALGLLRTLLHQILSMTDRDVFSVFPVHSAMASWTTGQQIEFEEAELIHAIDLSTQSIVSAKLLMIIDGLDEFSGSYEQRQSMCDLLHRISEYRNVKICVSSRPWNVYLDAFRRNPSLKLEDLTRNDIRQFVEAKLSTTHLATTRSLRHFEQFKQLVTQVVDKAQGVFLWVRLVLETLLTGIRDGDSIDRLNKTLDRIPSDLDEYFRQIMSAVDPTDREEASHFFEIALSGTRMTMFYYLLHEPCIPARLDAHRDLSDGLSATSIAVEIRDCQDRAKRRINARCMGLLEVVSFSNPYPMENVEFIHRTARDFLTMDDVRSILQSWQNKPFHVEEAIVHVHTLLLRSCVISVGAWLPLDKQGELAYEAVEALERWLSSYTEANGGDHFICDLRAEFNRLLPYSKFKQIDDPDFLHYLFEEGLTNCARSAIFTDQRLTPCGKRPVIDRAIVAFLRTKKDSSPFEEIFKRLLDLGESPNQVWNGMTMFCQLLVGIHQSSLYDSDRQALRRIISLFVEHGAIDAIIENEKWYLFGWGRPISLTTVETESVLRMFFETDETRTLTAAIEKNARLFARRADATLIKILKNIKQNKKSQEAIFNALLRENRGARS